MGKTSFQRRLFLQNLLLISIALVIVGGMFLFLMNSELSEGVKSSLVKKSSEAKNSIDGIISADLRNAKAISENPVFRQQLSDIEKTEMLNMIHSAYPIYSEITLIDVNKRTTLSTSKNSRKDWSEDKYFLGSLSGKISVSDVENIGDGKFAFWILSPVFYAGGSIGSVVAVQVPMDRIWSITDQPPIGDSGYFYILDGSGMIIAHRDKSLILKEPQYNFDFKALSIDGAIDFGDFVAGYSRISGTSEYPLAWTVFAVQPREDAYLGARSLTNTFLAFVLISFFISSAAAFLLSTKMSRPIIELRDGIKSALLGEGKYDFSVKTNDEVEEIADSFKEITGTMQEKEILERFKNNLEAKVKELEKMNKLLVGREMEIARLKHRLEQSKK